MPSLVSVVVLTSLSSVCSHQVRCSHAKPGGCGGGHISIVLALYCIVCCTRMPSLVSVVVVTSIKLVLCLWFHQARALMSSLVGLSTEGLKLSLHSCGLV